MDDVRLWYRRTELQKYWYEILNLKRTQRYWNVYLVNALN